MNELSKEEAYSARMTELAASWKKRAEDAETTVRALILTAGGVLRVSGREHVLAATLPWEMTRIQNPGEDSFTIRIEVKP